MCTVSFVNDGGGKLVFTSNRDENLARKPALPPQTYEINGQQVIFPRDEAAGGTWFVVNPARRRCIVLLNGAEVKHVATGNYRRSRGLIVLDMATAEKPFPEAWAEIDFDRIEPFTLVAFEKGTLHQLRWNGTERSIVPLPLTEPKIWASATLYTPETVAQRRAGFLKYLDQNQPPTPPGLVNLHCFSQNEDKENGWNISRDNGITTLSITQAVYDENGHFHIEYHNLLDHTIHTFDA